MGKRIKTYHLYKELAIPIIITLEWRRNTRISIGQKAVYLRIPSLSSERSIGKHMEWAKEWLEKQLSRKPDLLDRFRNRSYLHGDLLKINEQTFHIDIKTSNRKTIGIRVEDNKVALVLPEGEKQQNIDGEIKKALSRAFANYFLPEISARIMALNKEYFREDINGIRIKYNKSNWGSCSAKRNINISSRLLFAPKHIQDYVFIHELAHLKEMNHSPAFWNKVGQIIPDFKEKEKWLKAEGHLLDF